MRRILSAAMALLLVFGFAAGLYAPTLSAQGTSDVAGEAVLITDAAGEPMVEISIDSFTPEFEGYDQNYAPERGFQYALITATFTNVGAAPYVPNPYGFVLIDTEGFVAETAFALVDPALAPAMIDGTPIEPGATISGSVIFSVLAGTEAAAIGYEATYDRLTLLASSATNPTLGDPVEVLGPDARPLGIVTISEWLDPLPDVDLSSQPNRGYHFTGAVVTIENTSGSVWPIDPYTFRMVDSDGYVSSGTSAYRPEPEIADLTYSDLPAGESITGVIAFQTFNSAVPAYMIYQTSDQLALLGTFPDGPVVPDLASLPTVDAVFVPGESSTDDADSDATEEVAEDVSPECAEVETWTTSLFDRFSEDEALAAFDIENAADMTTDELIEVRDALESFDDDMQSEEPPALAEDFFNEFLDVIDYMIESLDDLVAASEDGDDLQPLVDEIVADTTELDEYSDAFDELYESCPNL